MKKAFGNCRHSSTIHFCNKSFNMTVKTRVCIINHCKELSGHMISSLHHRGTELSGSQCPGPVSREPRGWGQEPLNGVTEPMKG